MIVLPQCGIRITPGPYVLHSLSLISHLPALSPLPPSCSSRFSLPLPLPSLPPSLSLLSLPPHSLSLALQNFKSIHHEVSNLLGVFAGSDHGGPAVVLSLVGKRG